MYNENILAWESSLALIASVGLLVLSIRHRDEFLSEMSWNKLLEKSHALKSIFVLSFASIILYLIAQFTNIIQITGPFAHIYGLGEIIETIHMLVLTAAVLSMIPLFSAMRGAKNVA